MLVRTSDDVEALLRFLGQRRFVLAFDTESADYRWGAQLRLVQFGDCEQGFAIPWDSPAAAVVQKVVSEYRGRVVAHNLNYDLHVLENNGVDVSRWRKGARDTDLIARILDPAAFTFELKPLCDRHLGAAPDPQTALREAMRGRPLMEIQRALKEDDAWGESVVRNGVPTRAVRRGLGTALQDEARRIKAAETYTWETIPLDHPAYLTYAVNDVLITSQLYRDWLYPLISENDWSRSVIDYEHDIQSMLWAMETRGLRVDPVYTSRLQAQWADRLAELGDFFAELGVKNPNSNEQLIELLKHHGWKPKKFTKTGQAQLDSDVKKELTLDYPVAKYIIEWDRLTKWKSSYVDHFLADRDHNDRIHASIKAIGARTSRMSVAAPPLQQLPSGDATVRDCIIAGDGMSLVTVDYAAIELRIEAAYAGEEQLIEAFHHGLNPHLLTAQGVYGDHVTKDGPEYKLSKIVNYASIYGVGPSSLSVQAGIRKPEAQDFLNSFFELYAAIRRDMGADQRRAKKLGHVVLPDGRRLPVDPGHEYAATNYKVQGYAALVLKNALLRLRDAGLEEYILLPVHDEVVFECPASEAKNVMHLAEDVMRDDSLAVPLTTEGTIPGDRWGSKYRHEEKEAA